MDQAGLKTGKTVRPRLSGLQRGAERRGSENRHDAELGSA